MVLFLNLRFYLTSSSSSSGGGCCIRTFSHDCDRVAQFSSSRSYVASLLFFLSCCVYIVLQGLKNTRVCV